ncbi:MAG: hypothetical protein FD159_2034 [Syntrophaceae bacterium]|nr:MAG: hypothetical protein FD159_2034 [Syntrophaceae bacterium]
MKDNRTFINIQPDVLAAEIARFVETVAPSEQNVVEVQRQLLFRHVKLPKLEERVSPEEVVEGFFRCILTNHIQRHFKLEPGDIPNCINSSHSATRVICTEESDHNHQYIPDADWEKAWHRFQDHHPEVNIKIPGKQSNRRADLYFAVQGGIVSVEFKYVGSLNVEDCAKQMHRYIENHAATLLIIYVGRYKRIEVRGLDQLRQKLGPAVPVIPVHGPVIESVLTDLGEARKFFREEGLAFPTLPKKLASRLKKRGDYIFSTGVIDWDNYMSPYNLDYYIEEFENNHVEDYAVLAHSGHGINSYAIQYYLVYGRLGLFLHLGWGGVHMDADKESTKIRECFSLADQIVLALKNLESLGEKDRFLVVVSDFYGSYWLPPGRSRHGRDAVSEDPTEVLTEVLNWLRNS